MAPEKNQCCTLSITGLSHDGAGVGRTEQGYVLFVPHTAPGDLCEVRVVKALKHYGYGRLERLLSPSPDRCEPACPVFGRCGGCVYQHITYEAECRTKQQQVEMALQKELSGPQPVAPIVPSPAVLRYRNKVQLPVGLQDGHAVTGFFRSRSHQVIPCEDCLLQPREAFVAARLLCSHIDAFGIPVYDERTHRGLVRTLFVRVGAVTGQVMVVVVINGQLLPHAQELVSSLREHLPGLASVQLCHNTRQTNVILGDSYTTLWGAPTIEDSILGVPFSISAASFYQVNHAQCEALYRTAAQLAELDGTQKLLDLYCGIGSIGLSMAHLCSELVGVEVVPQAVADADACAKAAGIDNARFLCADAAQAAAALAAEGFRPDVVIVDPPRKGCEPSLLQTIADMAPFRVVYVSCNPATLARDLRILRTLGYELVQARPFDFFPRTAHVETVVLLSKLNTKQHIEVELNLDELDLTAAESKATYDEIKAYVLEKYGLKVSSLYISQVKRKCGLDVGQNYNLSKKEDAKVPQCPPEKEAAIMDALKHFQMIM